MTLREANNLLEICFFESALKRTILGKLCKNIDLFAKLRRIFVKIRNTRFLRHRYIVDKCGAHQRPCSEEIFRTNR